jgi:alpha-mannosidase
MYITEVSKDGELEKLGENFVAICVAEASTLGLTSAQVTGLQATFDMFDTSLTNLETKIQEKESATTDKDQKRDAFRTLVRAYAKRFRANTAIPDALLSQLAVAPHKVKGTKSAPTQPLSLLANPDAAGTVFLSWEKNGNISGTTYQIESQEPGDTSWTIIGTTTRAKFTFTGNPVGNEMSFRVIAIRRGINSLPSLPVTIFASGESATLQVAA